ncbi:MAG: phosphoribosylformylglycinamidine synthase subunit PurQ [Micavibrio sp.]|nr:phosphoribosylformylglycinamidine synthase subunit PurQ [Micavibrio sp.]
MKKPLFIVLSGDGINCERETAFALNFSGAETKIIHVNDLLAAPESLKTADGFAIPGGFSFGDELGSGQILALKIRHKLGDSFFKMVAAKKPVIGICNGFQVLVKLGLLPYPDAKERILALAANEQGSFINRWVSLNVNKQSVCQWTQGLDKATLDLPIRHGEGRIAFAKGTEEAHYSDLQQRGLIPLTYTEDVNGSYGRIAALTDPSGAVLGLMPHPEAFMFGETFKTPSAEAAGTRGDGALIFKNMLRIMKGEENSNERRFG